MTFANTDYSYSILKHVNNSNGALEAKKDET